MNTREFSPCFVTRHVDACRDFYQRRFSAKAIFDCGWYLNLRIGGCGSSIQFMQPKEGMVEYRAEGVVLNFRVDDVDAEYARLLGEGVEPAMPLEDHPWGDRGFSIIDPIGTQLYIYSDREPSDEFKQFYTA